MNDVDTALSSSAHWESTGPGGRVQQHRVHGQRQGDRAAGSKADKEQQLRSVFHTPPAAVAPTFDTSPSPFMASSWSSRSPVIPAAISPSATPSSSYSRPRTRKVARIMSRDTDIIGQAPTGQGASFSSQSSQSGFSPDGMEASPLALRESDQYEQDSLMVTTTLELSDVRSLSYYQHLPIKLEDLLSDTESSFDEGKEEEEEKRDGKREKGIRGAEDGVAKQLQVAKGFHRRRLLRRGMKVLVRNVLVKREVARMTVWHHQQWKLQLLFQKWKRAAVTRRKRRLHQTFTTWRRRTTAQSRLTEAIVATNGKRLSFCFRAWKLKVTEAIQRKRAQQHYKKHLKWKAFKRWRTVTVNTWQRKQLAVMAFQRTKALEKSFLIWRAVVLCRSESRQRGSWLLQRAQLRGVLQEWKDLVLCGIQQRQLGESLKSAIETRVLHGSLALWRRELMLRQKSEQVRNNFDLHQKRMAFLAWRRYIYYCTLKKLCEAYLSQQNTSLLQVSFNQWVCQTAALVGESFLSSRLSLVQRSSVLHTIFARWREVTRVSRGMERLRVLQERGLIVQCFQRWKGAMYRVRYLGSKCKELETWRTRQLLRKWRCHLMYRQQEVAAVDHHNTHTLQAAFVFWKAENSRQKALYAYVISHLNDQLRAAFVQWKALTHFKQETSKTHSAIQFYRGRLSKRCLLAWQIYARESVRESDERAQAAEKQLGKLRASLLLKVWRRQLHCHESARVCVAERSHRRLLKCFSSWRETTLVANEQASLLFITKLQKVLSTSSSQCDSSESLSILASASCNLGLGSPHFRRLSTSQYFSDASGLRSLSQHIQKSLDSSNTALHCPLLPHSSPILATDANDSAGPPLQLEDLDSGPEKVPVKRQLFSAQAGAIGGDSQHHVVAFQSKADYSVVDTQFPVESSPIHPPQSPSHMCSCLKPETIHQIQEIQLLLTELSPSHRASQEEAEVASPSVDDSRTASVLRLRRTQDELDGKDKELLMSMEIGYPILAPPPHFATEAPASATCIEQHHQSPLDNPVPPTHAWREGSPAISHHSSPLLPLDLDLVLSDLSVPSPLQHLCYSVRYMKLYPCSKAFLTWRDYAGRKRATRKLGQLLEERFRMRKIGKFFGIWKELSLKVSQLRALETGLLRRSNVCALRARFSAWKEAVQQRQENEKAELIAVEFYESSCLRQHFLLWREAVLRAEEDGKQQMTERALVLRRFFTCWRKRAELRQRTRKLLTRWKHTTKARKERQQAEVMCNYWTLSHAWRTWRVQYVKEVAAAAVARKSDRELIKHVFSSWKHAS